MSCSLHILPDSNLAAAENMARDFLLLNHYPEPNSIRLRHYGWERPSYTFGLSQSYQYAHSKISVLDADFVRRPTGGGVVNHQHDWTYSLIIPASHSLGQLQPIETYKAVHQCIVRAMKSLGAKVALNQDAPSDSMPRVCFEKPEVYDVVLENLSAKVAGAAQKRTKSGYLMQGSIWKPTLPKLDWNSFHKGFINEITNLTDAKKSFVTWPKWDHELISSCLSRFESAEWKQRR